jgi:hypothetical protein
MYVLQGFEAVDLAVAGSAGSLRRLDDRDGLDRSPECRDGAGSVGEVVLTPCR